MSVSQPPASKQYAKWKKYPKIYAEPTHEDWERENAALRAELEAAGSVVQEQEIVIGLIAKALGVSDEPHQGYHARVLEAAESCSH